MDTRVPRSADDSVLLASTPSHQHQSFSAPPSGRSSPRPVGGDLTCAGGSSRNPSDYQLHQNRKLIHPESTSELKSAAPTRNQAGPLQRHSGSKDPQSQQTMTQEVHNSGLLTSFNPSGSGSAMSKGLSRPLKLHEQEKLAYLDRLKVFLATAPSRWESVPAFQNSNGIPSSANYSSSLNGLPPGHPSSTHPALNRFLLPTSEYVSCVLWNGLYHITGTDIVRALVFRFDAFGRPVRNIKKFEEGVFSDLRNLKPGVDACLEEPKSPFLDLLFKYQCIRTQKKQKVFYWFSVPHDRLFLDALERDLKREKMGLEPTTAVVGEPALSFVYDSKKSLYEQFSKGQGGLSEDDEVEPVTRQGDGTSVIANSDPDGGVRNSMADVLPAAGASLSEPSFSDGTHHLIPRNDSSISNHLITSSPGFFSFSIFEGSPSYKQRRKKTNRAMLRSFPSPGISDFYGQRSLSDGSRLAYDDDAMDILGYGSKDVGMTAADMFVAQARGEGFFSAESHVRERRGREVLTQAGIGATDPLLYAVHSPQPSAMFMGMSTNAPLVPVKSATTPSAASPEVVHPAHRRPKLQEEHRHNTYPLTSRFNQGYPVAPYPQTGHVDPSHTADSSQAVPVVAVKTKAFACPLFSCGRLFKRMEHLTRHLRTHTMERPFECDSCQKRFSRSDNLTQHLRTHDRGLVGDMANVHTWTEGVDGLDPESEDLDELDSDHLPLDSGDFFNGIENLSDIQLCEVEVQGQIHEVQGDEEGLITTPGNVQAMHGASGRTFQHRDDVSYHSSDVPTVMVPSQYVDNDTRNGAFVDSLGHQWTTLNTGDGSLNSSPASFAEPLPAPYPTTHPSPSLSAPSYKQTFDQTSLYPPDLGIGAAFGPGPIRRHRSMTPSLMRHHTDSTRSLPSSRGYHPYISSSLSSSSRGSPHSSPLAPAVEFSPSQVSTSTSTPSGSRSNSAQPRSMMTYQPQPHTHRIFDVERVDSPFAMAVTSTAESSYMGSIAPAESSRDAFASTAADIYPSSTEMDKHVLQGYATYPPGMSNTQEETYGSQSQDSNTFSYMVPPHNLTL